MTVLFNIKNGETITILTYFSSTNLIGAFSRIGMKRCFKVLQD